MTSDESKRKEREEKRRTKGLKKEKQGLTGFVKKILC
jgi:hypothetical protein